LFVCSNKFCHDLSQSWRIIAQRDRGASKGARLSSARRFSSAARVLPLVVTALLAFSPGAHAQAPGASCEEGGSLAVLISPVAPWKGAPLRVMFSAEHPHEGELSLIAPDGKVAATSRQRFGGPPYTWIAEVASPAVGKWQAKLARSGASAECATVVRDIDVRRAATGVGAARGSVWPIRAAWNRATENLYSAWIEKLFDAPQEEALSWKALHEVLRDKSRNFLFNHLNAGEDQKGLVIQPDCADLPYFLRAYFAFKMGLPFGYAKCNRGGGGKPPQCPAWWNIQKEEPPPAPPQQEYASNDPFGFFGAPVAKPRPVRVQTRPPGLVPGFGFYLRTTVANGVHSGSGRTAADDDDTDYYPVALKQETLRPGTIYADPYGHILVIVKRIPQTPASAGVILAVDGQPDGTVARKRFWRGNFLFAQDPALGGPGFKRFRPILATKGGLRRLANAEIAENPDYADFSLDQAKLSIEDFYDRMDDVMSPAPLDPLQAMKEAITSLEEQVKTRVTSVENGRKYQTGGGAEVAMPDGASIFETTGAWEDFATPSRDLRLLIAIDVVRTFPERVARRPERYAMPAGKTPADVKAELESVLAAEIGARKFSYTRSDGSPWTLALQDVVARTAALEMAYNVNDCVELRWGAVEGSEEAATCKRRAPAAQRGKMSEYRSWFTERRRPPRA
jgi:hypothetical protein